MNKPQQLDGAQAGTHSAVAMTPGKGLLILTAVVVVIGVFLVLCHQLGVTEAWAAFLFLLYWASIEHTAFEKLPACIAGAALGLLLGYLLQTLPVWLGGVAGGAAFLGALLIVVYFQIMGWLTVLVNTATMLYLTVGTISHVQSGVSFPAAFIALAAGALFFAGLVWGGQMLLKRN